MKQFTKLCNPKVKKMQKCRYLNQSMLLIHHPCIHLTNCIHSSFSLLSIHLAFILTDRIQTCLKIGDERGGCINLRLSRLPSISPSTACPPHMLLPPLRSYNSCLIYRKTPGNVRSAGILNIVILSIGRAQIMMMNMNELFVWLEAFLVKK